MSILKQKLEQLRRDGRTLGIKACWNKRLIDSLQIVVMLEQSIDELRFVATVFNSATGDNLKQGFFPASKLIDAIAFVGYTNFIPVELENCVDCADYGRTTIDYIS